ncbi:hypothetical protein [Pantoea sp. BAV 3049]|uniref:Tse2 family ADP-ribosyltransferase toxin n=1 Tax=Pantoea sp. BAV 3049 TaxID=2654188 RepID=UPI00131E00FF|nr:hypothetical protein [Pantoea sp. BAV 3049]
MINEMLLYLIDIDQLNIELFRSGNASTPNFSEVRALKDLTTYQKVDDEGEQVLWVIANGGGFSTFDHITSGMKRQGKNIWKLKKGALLPAELRLVRDYTPGKKGHYMIAPLMDMTLEKYLKLINDFGKDSSKCIKLTSEEIKNG